MVGKGVRDVKEVKMKKEEVNEVKVKEMEDGKEDITTTTTTTATAVTFAKTQLPALESAQDTLAPVLTAQEVEGPVGLSGQTGLEAKEQAEMDMGPGNPRMEIRIPLPPPLSPPPRLKFRFLLYSQPITLPPGIQLSLQAHTPANHSQRNRHHHHNQRNYENPAGRDSPEGTGICWAPGPTHSGVRA